MSHARETTLFVHFLKNPSIMPLGIFLVHFSSTKRPIDLKLGRKHQGDL